jgi:hypothetical protein
MSKINLKNLLAENMRRFGTKNLNLVENGLTSASRAAKESNPFLQELSAELHTLILQNLQEPFGIVILDEDGEVYWKKVNPTVETVLLLIQKYLKNIGIGSLQDFAEANSISIKNPEMPLEQVVPELGGERPNGWGINITDDAVVVFGVDLLAENMRRFGTKNLNELSNKLGGWISEEKLLHYLSSINKNDAVNDIQEIDTSMLDEDSLISEYNDIFRKYDIEYIVTNIKFDDFGGVKLIYIK